VQLPDLILPASSTGDKEISMNGNLLNGGEFLLADTAGMEIFSPEEFTTEQKQIAETTEEFMKNEVFPNIERIEDRDFGFVVEKLRQCADLGLFLAEVPEEYGGLELEKTTNMLMIEKVAPAASFCMAFSGHTGIGILPWSTTGPLTRRNGTWENSHRANGSGPTP